MNTPTHLRSPDGPHRRPSTEAATMRAIVQDRYGSSDTWQLTDTDRPEIEPDEVLVRVHAAGLDRGTWHSMTGRPYLMRIMGFGLRAPKNRVPGLAVAGTVAAVGANVTRFAVGDEVFGVGRGAFAEYAAAREDKLAPKPSNLTFEQAAAVPDLRDHGPPGAAPRPNRGRTEGPDHRRVRRRRHLRRAAREGLRRRGHRRVQHGQGRPRPVARRRPRHRLHRPRTSPTARAATT